MYYAAAQELLRELQETREKIYDYNALRPSETQKMLAILKGLLGHIGDNVTIGAGSVVVSDIPSNTVAVGNPCKVIKKI